MNITSVNLTSSAPSSKIMPGDDLPVSEKGERSEDFKNALKSLEKKLGETTAQAEPPRQPQSVDIAKNSNASQKDSPDQKELLALFTLSEASSAVREPTVTSTDVAPSQDMSSAIAMNGLPFIKPASEDIKLDPAAQDKEIEASFQKTTVFGQSPQNAVGNSIPSTDSKEPEKLALTASVESTSITELEKTAPNRGTEMLGIQKPVDAKTDNFVIAKPITHPGWSKDLGEQIVWMNNKEIAAAEIKLNPLHLGPISIRIDVGQDNQTSIQFTAQQTETKEALEASIPKLREMLQGQQLNLGNVTISQNTNSNNGRQPSQSFYGNPGNPETSRDTGVGGLEMHEADVVVSKGLLSLYA